MSEAGNHLAILSELEQKVRSSTRNSDNSMHYSSKRRSRRDQIRSSSKPSSKTLGSSGDQTAPTVRSDSSSRSSKSSRSTASRSDSSSSLSSYESFSDKNAISISGSMRARHVHLMDELQEKVERMNALNAAGRRRSNSGNWRRSSRRSRSGSGSRSSSLGSSERSGGSSLDSSERSGGSGRSSQRSRSSGRRSAKRGTKQEYARRRSSSTETPRAASTPLDAPPSLPPRAASTPLDAPPSLPSRRRRDDSPEKTKEPFKWTPPQPSSSRSPARQRSPSNGAGSANGSFQVSQSKNLGLSSNNGSRSQSRGRRRSRAATEQRAASESPNATDPLENLSIPGAFSVHSSGQISLLSSPSIHTRVGSTLAVDSSDRSTVSSLSSSSSHYYRQSNDHSGRSRRSSRGHRRSLDSSMRSASSSVHSRSSLQSWPEEEEEVDDDYNFAGENTITSRTRSILKSVLEEPSEPVITASVTRDIEEELEEARAEGRREALNEVTRNHSSDDILVVNASSDDESMASEIVDETKKRKVLCYVFLLCCLLLVFGIGVTALLFLGKANGIKDVAPYTMPPTELIDDESNLWGIIIYTPPSEEECEAIANCLVTEEQRRSLILKSFEIHIEITLTSEEAYKELVSDLVQHIQEKLVPKLAGCEYINFFDATIALNNGMSATTTNTTSAIKYGEVQASSESDCEDDPVGNCKSYVLILDLYLEEEKSNSILLEAIGETVTSDSIAGALGLVYPVQGVSVEALSEDGTSAVAPTDAPIQDSGTDPEVVPTDSPSAPIPAPTAAPVVDQTGSNPVTSAPV